MEKMVIITGINKGLGQAFFNFFLQKKKTIIIGITRNLNEEQLKIQNKFNNVIFVEKDLSTLKNIDEEIKLQTYYSTEIKEIVFINNAASINPIEAIGNLNEDAIFKAFQLNTIAPILLTNHIIKNNRSKLIRIFNISSGAANKPIVGWGLYCSAKSANEMFFKTLELQEETNNNIEVYNIDPGVMDTDMQKNIRSKEKKIMPNVDQFKDYYHNKQLKSAKEVALDIINRCNI